MSRNERETKKMSQGICAENKQRKPRAMLSIKSWSYIPPADLTREKGMEKTKVFK